jgi:hypothetical protein
MLKTRPLLSMALYFIAKNTDRLVCNSSRDDKFGYQARKTKSRHKRARSDDTPSCGLV